MSWLRTKSVNKQLKFTVFGYLHEFENHHEINIPKMIKYICLNYYLLSEEFTKHGNKMILNKAKNMVSKSGDNNATRTVYGNVIISDKDESIIEYQWNLKIKKVKKDVKYLWFSFGIDSSGKHQLNGDFSNDYWNNCEFYGLSMNFLEEAVYLRKHSQQDFDNNEIKEYAMNFDVKETTWYDFKMMLNMKNKTLKFEFNDENIPIYHSDVSFKNNKEYYMAIAIYQDNLQIKLTDFMIKQY